MHELDYELTEAMESAKRLAANQDLAALIDADLIEYRTAASLSRGKDPQRATYWAFRAHELRAKLRRKMKLRPVRD